ncbi:MAG: serine hydrolase [Patescibacteria group bacterium]
MTKGLKTFLTAFAVSLPFWWGINVFQKNFDAYLTAQISEPLEQMVSFDYKREQKPMPDITADAVLSVRLNPSGKMKVMVEENAGKSLPIASVTKLMTAFIVLEDPENFGFSKIITISNDAASQGTTPNYGNLKVGEKYTLEELVELMLIYSSNHAAFALSETIGTDAFVERMNEKAQEMGMINTHFTNPTGLDPKDGGDLNYSTANDLILLTREILKTQPSIFRIGAKAHNYNSIENGLSNLILPDDDEFIGGKTGYTTGAGGCILYLFKDQNENTYVNVILGTGTEDARISQMQKLINWLSV